MIKLSTHQEKILVALAKKAGLETNEYLLDLVLREYRKVFKKNYLL
jgi:hypothetical protein